MKTIKLNLGRRSYNIVVGSGITGLLGKYLNRTGIGRDAYIITTPPIKQRFAALLSRALRRYGFSVKFRVVADSEKSKSIQAAGSIVNALAAYDKKKRIFIIALGGGVVGDLAGFVASVYRRGIPYIQVPTTLLAQVDSSIGGKTAVDLKQAKNLVGAFYQPSLVYSDIGLLKTLDARQVKSGLAEVVKYALIKDRGLFAYLERQRKTILAKKAGALEHIVWQCAKIKAGIVQKDEREEKGLRTILNFGHTIGHAIEAASGYKGYNHGEAVALGMLVALDISHKLGLCGIRVAQRTEKLLEGVGLPTVIRGVALKRIIRAHYHDKKFSGAKNRFVLIDSNIGRVKIVEDIPLRIIQEALEKRIERGSFSRR